MLTLMLAAALALPQDGAPATEAAETPSAVLNFLQAAEDQLYDPREAGLTALSFEVPLVLPLGPQPVEIASISVSWEVDSEPRLTGRRADPMPDAVKQLPPQLIDQLTANPEPQGLQYLSYGLGDLFGQLLATHTGALATRDGSVAVEFTPKPGTPPGLPNTTWIFDEDGLPTGSSLSVSQQGPMGAMNIDINNVMTFKPGPDGKLLLDSVKAVQSTSGSIIGESTTTLSHVEHDGLWILTQTEAKAVITGMPVQPPPMTTALRNIKVNGEALRRAPAAPAADQR